MKNIYILISFILCTAAAYSQQKYKVDGELQFVDRNGNIIIRKDGQYKVLDLNPDIDRHTLTIRDQSRPTLPGEYEALVKDTAKIYLKDIVSKNLKKLDGSYFTTPGDTVEGIDAFQLYRFNREVFALLRYEEDEKKFVNKNALPYIALDFGKGKTILMLFGDYTIYAVPLKNKIAFVSNRSAINEAFVKYETTPLKTLKAAEMFTDFFNGLDLSGDYYHIDTLANRKVIIRNYNHERVIPKAFDSITYNDFFIIGYHGKKKHIYNYTFKDLRLHNIRVACLNRYIPKLEVLQGNAVRTLNLAGTTYLRGDGPAYLDFSFQFPDRDALLNIVKKEGRYFITADSGIEELCNLAVRNADFTYNLYHTAVYDSIQYTNDPRSVTLYSESGFMSRLPILVYGRLKSGKYDLNTLDYFCSENPDANTLADNEALPKNLDHITVYREGIYLIEKEGLVTYYPIMKELRYKRLGAFEGYFARYELPDGHKGWLAFDGKEYPDE